MDIQQFRKSKRDEFDRVAKIIDENFEAICNIAKELHEPTRIETPYGTFTFQSEAYFAYKRAE